MQATDLNATEDARPLGARAKKNIMTPYVTAKGDISYCLVDMVPNVLINRHAMWVGFPENEGAEPYSLLAVGKVIKQLLFEQVDWSRLVMFVPEVSPNKILEVQLYRVVERDSGQLELEYMRTADAYEIEIIKASTQHAVFRTQKKPSLLN
ncbi:MAG: hypothetical protein C9356_12080 [Oleiphilus sp.]|nr:MAG: hypothetical protein C9356_12080 [Oleiphilus sp.]